MSSALGWIVLSCLCVASLAGAVLSRPLRRWTTPRELVVVGDPFATTDTEPVSFEGWTVERDGPASVRVHRGTQHESVSLFSPALVRSDEAGTFLDVDLYPRPPCGLMRGFAPSYVRSLGSRA